MDIEFLVYSQAVRISKGTFLTTISKGMGQGM